MAQKLIQTQEQKQVQVQRLTQQQMMLVKMLEMPLTELEQSVSAELDDNPALESCDPDKMDDANGMMDMHDGAEALAEEADGDDYDKAQEREVNAALSNTFGFGGHNACVIFKKYAQ